MLLIRELPDTIKQKETEAEAYSAIFDLVLKLEKELPMAFVFYGQDSLVEHDEKYEMHRLIGALLSSELKEQEKLDIIEHEYNIPTSQEFREDVRIMCNLSTGIEERATERATEKTSEKFILNMYKKGYTLDQIADVAETDVDEVEAIIKKKEPAMA